MPFRALARLARTPPSRMLSAMPRGKKAAAAADASPGSVDASAEPPAPKRKRAAKQPADSEGSDDATAKAAKPAKGKKAKAPPATEAGDGFPRNTTMPDTYSLNAPPPTSIKIVSWNVSSLKAAAKKGLPAYVAAENADLLLLQETKLQDAAGLDVLSRKDYPHQFWLASEDKKGYSGSAVLSKIEPISHRYGIGVAEHDKEGRTITLELPKFFLVACYIPNAGQKLERLAYKGEYMTAMETYLKGLAAKKPIIWAGDLNVAHQEVDLARPKENRNKSAGFTDQERGDFSRILDTLGLVDTYRHFHPDTRDFSYYSYRFQCRSKHLGWRLDYFVASKSLVDEGKISESGIRSEVYGASDHVPVYLFVEK